MFPTHESHPVREALRRGIDLAVEFATLGEYPLLAAEEEPADRWAPPRPPAPEALPPRSSAVRPASAAALRRSRARGPAPSAPADRPPPVEAAHPAVRGRGGGCGPVRTRLTGRARDGAAPAPPQPCVSADGQP
jgi:hypothetical protein